MKKSHGKDRVIKRAVLVLILQVLIVGVFALIACGHLPADEGRVKNITVDVEGVFYEYQFLNGRMFYVVSGSNEYHFPKFPVFGTQEYSAAMLYDAVHTGDKLILEYVEDGKYNEVLGARTGDTTLRTVAAYNEYMRSQRVLDVITFSVVEIFWLAGAVLFWLLHRKELRTVLTRKRKRKKACESHNQLSNIS